jgi:hypothetical protein
MQPPAAIAHEQPARGRGDEFAEWGDADCRASAQVAPYDRAPQAVKDTQDYNARFVDNDIEKT